VDDYSDYLYRFALARVRNHEVARDLVQETFLAALRSSP
jgi:DNA-directed RNA polymerase specialized sigma24 family protein